MKEEGNIYRKHRPEAGGTTMGRRGEGRRPPVGQARAWNEEIPNATWVKLLTWV